MRGGASGVGVGIGSARPPERARTAEPSGRSISEDSPLPARAVLRAVRQPDTVAQLVNSLVADFNAARDQYFALYPALDDGTVDEGDAGQVAVADHLGELLARMEKKRRQLRQIRAHIAAKS